MAGVSGSRAVRHHDLKGLFFQFSFPLNPILRNAKVPQLTSKPASHNPKADLYLLILLRTSCESLNPLGDWRMRGEKIADTRGRERLNNKKMRRGRRRYHWDSL